MQRVYIGGDGEKTLRNQGATSEGSLRSAGAQLTKLFSDLFVAFGCLRPTGASQLPTNKVRRVQTPLSALLAIAGNLAGGDRTAYDPSINGRQLLGLDQRQPMDGIRFRRRLIA
jgi:hypothetical protein